MTPKTSPAGRFFVGRATELGVLAEALDAALTRGGGLVLVGGEPGIGKTALVDRHLEHADRSQVRWIRSRCLEAESAPPFGPWVQALQRLARSGFPPSRPELRRWLAGAQGTTEVDRMQLFDMIADHLVGASREHGLIIVIDDAQWADASSLLLLRELADELPSARLQVIVTCRGDPARASGMDELARRAGTYVLSLARLDDRDVVRYVERTLGAHFAATHGGEFARRTAGHPLYMTELARLVASGGALQAVPESAREVLRRRLAGLPDATRRILERGAVIGVEFDLQLLADVDGDDPQHAIAKLDAAAGAGIVMSSLDPPSRFRFQHDLLRDAVYEELPPSVRMRLHRQVAEALERRWRSDLDDHLTELSFHWLRAADAGASPAATWTLRAAEHSVDRLAYEDGVRLYESALRIPGLPDRAGTLLGLARCQYLAGRIKPAFETCRALADIARREKQPEVLAEAALVLEGVSDPEIGPEMAQMCDEALQLLQQGNLALRARLLGQIAVQHVYSDFGRLAAISGEALALAERSRSADALVAALRARQMARSGPDGVDERLALAGRMIEIGTATRQPRLVYWGRLWRVDAFLQLADFAALDDELDALRRLVDRLRQPLTRWHLVRLLCARAAFRGEFGEALALADQAREIGRRGGHGIAERTWVAVRVAIAIERGEEAQLADLVGRVHNPLAVVKLMNGMALHLIGRQEEARSLVDGAEAQLRAQPLDSQWLGAASALSDHASITRRTASAEWLYPRLRPYAGMLPVPGAGPPVMIRGSVSLWLGTLAALLGEADAAAHFEHAIALLDRLGARPYAARARLEYAIHLNAAGRPDLVRSLAEKALTMAGEVGSRPTATRAEALLRGLPTPSAAGPLTRREAQIAELVAQGLTSREIAGRLFLSERTVENHVQNALGKLGFRSRSQIAAWVAGGRAGGN